MVNNAQRSTSPNYGSNTATNRLLGNNNLNNFNSFTQFNYISANTTPYEMGRRLERVVSAPALQTLPKSCLRRKSCQHKSNTPATIEVTDKNTDTEQKR